MVELAARLWKVRAGPAVVAVVVSALYVVWIEAAPEAFKGGRLGPIRLNAKEHYDAAQINGRWEPSLLYRGRCHHLLIIFYATTNLIMADSIFNKSELPLLVLVPLGFGIGGGVAGHFLEYYGFLTGQNIPFGTAFGPVVFFLPSVLGMMAVMLELVLSGGGHITWRARTVVSLVALLSGAAEALGESTLLRSTTMWHAWHVFLVHLPLPLTFCLLERRSSKRE